MVKNKKLYITVFILAIIVAFISGSYAYFTASATSSNITGSLASFSLGLNMSKVSSEGILIPLEDDYLENAVGESCEAGEDNIVCQIYKITLSNTGTSGVTLEGNITLSPTTGSTVTNLKWVKLSDSTTIDSAATVNGMSKSTLVSSNYIEGNSTQDFYIVVWDSYSDDTILDIGSYTGEVSFSTNNGQVISANFGD
jgi:predicted ribosomally synthesized peptide with SipW-like signal peptide